MSVGLPCASLSQTTMLEKESKPSADLISAQKDKIKMTKTKRKK